jgi:DNA repair protein RadC
MKDKICQVNEEPAAKLIAKGTSSLSDPEIVAILIGGSRAEEKSRSLMVSIDYRYEKLARINLFEFRKMGLTIAEGTRLIASLEMGRRRQLQSSSDKIIVKMSRDIFDLMKPYLTDLVHEEFWAIYLNRANVVIAKEKISQGGISGTVTDVRIVMKKAIECLASGIILCHNHPSGNLNPSDSDISITKKIFDSGAILDVQVMDHIIISENDYYSMADNGLM